MPVAGCERSPLTSDGATHAQKNSSYASMEGYTLEGTKKTGASVKRRASVLDEARKTALAEQALAPPSKK